MNFLLFNSTDLDIVLEQVPEYSGLQVSSQLQHIEIQHVLETIPEEGWLRGPHVCQPRAEHGLPASALALENDPAALSARGAAGGR